ncbi:MAG: xylose isomerase [Verrucomicrobia bacterium]|nr:xylose isomerase [Verrucomicrobiota bacterium]
MIAYPTKKREWSLERKVRAMKEAGFDGIATIVNPEIKALADRFDLVIMGGFDGSNAKRAREQIIAQRDLGVFYLNVQLLNHDTAPAEAAKLAVKLIELSEELGVAVHVETHRDTATETPEKFDEIARLFQKATGKLMPVTWDHSHFAVSKHLLPEAYVPRLLAWPKLIQNSNLFHLRPFNAQHCQVPVADRRGALTPEFKDYLAFVEELFLMWLDGPRPRNELWVCPELGVSHGYHLSLDPSPWTGAVRARQEYKGAWHRALKRTKRR